MILLFSASGINPFIIFSTVVRISQRKDSDEGSEKNEMKMKIFNCNWRHILPQVKATLIPKFEEDIHQIYMNNFKKIRRRRIKLA